MFHRVGADLYGHLHGIVITGHPQNLSFIDFAKCTMAESPEKAKWKIQQNKWEPRQDRGLSEFEMNIYPV